MKRIFLLLLLTVFAAGCGNDTAPPDAPKVVSKRIAKPPAPHKPRTAAAKVAASPAVATPRKAPPIKLSAAAEKPKAGTEAGTASPAVEKAGAVLTPQKPAAKTQTAAPVTTAAAAETAVKKDGVVLASKKPVGALPPQVPAAEPAAKSAGQVSEKTDASVPAEGEPEANALVPEESLKPRADLEGGYSAAGKIDPFLPLFEEKPVVPEEKPDAEKQKKKRRMPLTPLERVDLSQLKLVGIIQAPSGNRALVEESSGKGYIIKKGTFIGIHTGRVLEIQKDRVVVEEEVENVLGQYTPEKKELKLQKPPGEF